ncbi:unnamed protein product [Pleuronectes platessa]|uniref:Uncharacterized protein n=1 Tax=Pleuronectes platessa TaxID=8262 RepID=A0A9N7YXE8_PLEPL|nr:unnamed protein product [Pleuronectes platessa]
MGQTVGATWINLLQVPIGDVNPQWSRSQWQSGWEALPQCAKPTDDSTLMVPSTRRKTELGVLDLPSGSHQSSSAHPGPNAQNGHKPRARTDGCYEMCHPSGVLAEKDHGS